MDARPLLKIIPKFRKLKNGDIGVQFRPSLDKYWISMDMVYEYIKSGVEIDLDLDLPQGVVGMSYRDRLPKETILYKFLMGIQKFEPDNQIDLFNVIRRGGFLSYIKELESVPDRRNNEEKR